MLTRRERKKLAIIEYACINLEKRKEFKLSPEEIKQFVREILYRVHIQKLIVGNTIYIRKDRVIKNGVTWNLENVRTFLRLVKYF